MENKRSFNPAWYNEDPANTDIKSDDVERTWLGGPREERGPDARARTACARFELNELLPAALPLIFAAAKEQGLWFPIIR